MMRYLAKMILVAMFVSLLCVVESVAEKVLPGVKVSNVRRVFYNGEHNAFTDLVRFQGKFYLTFRSCPDGHMVYATATIIVLVSDDAKTWKQVHRFNVPQRDTRDPHFLVFKKKLFVYTGTWYAGDKKTASKNRDLNQHLGYAVWSGDGEKWSGPTLLEGTFGHYIWRASSYEGKAYLCGRRKINFDIGPRGEPRKVESLMLESDDGLVFKKRAIFQAVDGDETAFLFEADGAVVGIGRRGRGTAQLLRAEWPWTKWKRVGLSEYVGGPLVARWGARTIVGGRRTVKGKGARMVMYWLANDKLHSFAELPSGGDTSYPGFIALSDSKAIMSWYSSHEKDENGKTITAIYMADLELE